MKIEILLLAILFLCACSAKDKTAAESASTTTHAGPLDSAALQAFESPDIDSIIQVKNRVFTLFEENKGRDSFERFDMFVTDDEGIYHAEIFIGKLFHPKEKAAAWAWSTSDTTMDLVVMKFAEGGWQKMFEAQALPSLKSGSFALRSNCIFFNDYNHDGWNDLEVIIDSWEGIANGYKSRLWLVHEDRFTPVKHFDKIISPIPDSTQNMIYSCVSNGCGGALLNFSEWRLEQASVRRTAFTSIDCCENPEGPCWVNTNKKKRFQVPVDQIKQYMPGWYIEQILGE